MDRDTYLKAVIDKQAQIGTAMDRIEYRIGQELESITDRSLGEWKESVCEYEHTVVFHCMSFMQVSCQSICVSRT